MAITKIEKNTFENRKIKLNNTKSFSDTDLILAKLIEISYKSINDRPINFNFNGIILEYKSELSTSFYSHYENGGNIIISLHGANSIELYITAISIFTGLSQGNILFRKFCNKFNELLESKKNVILSGHSLGGYAVHRCMEEFNKSITAVLFAPYTPLINETFSKSKARKIIYKSDFLSNKILRGKFVNNTLEFKAKVISTAFLDSHATGNFLKINQMKNDLFKVHHVGRI